MAEKQVKDYDKFNLRFPDGMREAIAERARLNGRSMNSEIIQVLQDALNSNTEDSLIQELEGVSVGYADTKGVHIYNNTNEIIKFIEKRTEEFRRNVIEELKQFNKDKK